MQCTVSIPDAIYQTVLHGAGRSTLQRDFALSQSHARYYCRLVEEHHAAQTKKTALILADLHIPEHDEKVLTTVLQKSSRHAFDVVVLLGDVIDCGAVSHWRRHPSLRRLGQELERVVPVLAWLTQQVKHIPRKIYVTGNHEDWITQYLWDRAVEISDLPCLSVPALLHLEELGWEYIANKERLAEGLPPLQLGGMNLLHGHEVKSPSLSVINPAKNYCEKLYEPVILGHVHRTSAWPPRTLLSWKPLVYTVGCLQRLTPEYAVMNRWNHGLCTLQWTDTTRIVKNYQL